MTNYEYIAVFDAARPDEEIQAAIEQLREKLTSLGSDIAYVEPWGRRRMAYEIKKRVDGYYVIFYFRAVNSPARELERLARISEILIRHLLCKVPRLKTEADAQREEALREAERKAREEAEQKAAEARQAEAAAPEAAEQAPASPPAEEAASAASVEPPAAEPPAAEAPAAASAEPAEEPAPAEESRELE